MKIIRINPLVEKIGLGKTTIYRKIRAGLFPKPFHICGGKVVGWLESDIDAWIAAHIQPVTA